MEKEDAQIFLLEKDIEIVVVEYEQIREAYRSLVAKYSVFVAILLFIMGSWWSFLFNEIFGDEDGFLGADLIEDVILMISISLSFFIFVVLWFSFEKLLRIYVLKEVSVSERWRDRLIEYTCKNRCSKYKLKVAKISHLKAILDNYLEVIRYNKYRLALNQKNFYMAYRLSSLFLVFSFLFYFLSLL